MTPVPTLGITRRKSETGDRCKKGERQRIFLRIAQFSILHFQFSILHKKEPETLVSGSFILLQLEGSGIELIIFAMFRDQLLMVAALDDMTEL